MSQLVEKARELGYELVPHEAGMVHVGKSEVEAGMAYVGKSHSQMSTENFLYALTPGCGFVIRCAGRRVYGTKWGWFRKSSLEPELPGPLPEPPLPIPKEEKPSIQVPLPSQIWADLDTFDTEQEYRVLRQGHVVGSWVCEPLYGPGGKTEWFHPGSVKTDLGVDEVITKAKGWFEQAELVVRPGQVWRPPENVARTPSGLFKVERWACVREHRPLGVMILEMLLQSELVYDEGMPRHA